jgi:ComF family protein
MSQLAPYDAFGFRRIGQAMDDSATRDIPRPGRGLRPLRRAAVAALDLVLPPRCIRCAGKVDAVGTLCAECWRRLVFVAEPCCVCCGLPFAFDAGADNLCAGCVAHPPRFDRARSVFIYDDHSRGLILSLKHGDRLHGVPAFGNWLARAGAPLLADADLLVPVPLHWMRLWRRRYNQSALLAQAIARALRQHPAAPAVAPDLLIRKRRTPSQGRRTRSQRADNVRGAFRVSENAVIQGKRIVLIDDVLTSGATVEECAKVLRRAGAARIDVLTLARAVRTG